MILEEGSDEIMNDVWEGDYASSLGENMPWQLARGLRGIVPRRWDGPSLSVHRENRLLSRSRIS